MYIEVLVEEKIKAGESVRRELQSAGYKIERAFWYRIPDGFWRLVIGSETVDQVGPLRAYHALNEILTRLDLRGTMGGSVALLGSHDPGYRQFLRDAIGPGRFGLSWNPQFQSNPFQDAYFYD